MTGKKACFLTCLIILLPAVITGCIGGTSQKSTYYILNASRQPSALTSALSDQGLGVGPITMPDFLKRPQIVTRQTENILEINEFHRWGDSLESQVASVLVENLSSLLNTPQVSAFPWERHFVPKYQLYIDFKRFEGKPSGPVVLEAVWRIVEKEQNYLLITRRTALEEPTNGSSYSAYVIAMNTALNKLSLEIAQGIAGIAH